MLHQHYIGLNRFNQFMEADSINSYVLIHKAEKQEWVQRFKSRDLISLAAHHRMAYLSFHSVSIKLQNLIPHQ